MPVVSVIIPCYNAEKYILDAIESIDSQDYPRKAVIITDDCSTDSSYNVVLNKLTEIEDKGTHKFGLYNNTYVAILSHESSRGPSAARNTAIKFAWKMTDMFAVLDADDKYLPGKLSKSVEVLMSNPIHIGLVYSDVIIENLSDNTKEYEFRKPYNRLLLEKENIISNATLINKVALDKVGLYDEELRTCEDWDLWLRITEKFVAIHIPEALQVYRVTNQNATFTVNKSQWEKDWQTVQNKLRVRLNG